MLLIITAFLLVLLISFFCSLCEAVLLSLSPAFVAVVAEGKAKYGKLLSHHMDNPDRSISAILTLNTVSHTMGAAWIASLVHQEFDETWVTLASVILTFLVLVFSEILPKTIGKNHSKALAPVAAYGIQFMIVALYPLVKLSEMISKTLSTPSEVPDVTREEMIMTAEIGVEEGTIKAKESKIISNLLKLDKIYVSDIMTPRSVFTALDGAMSVDEVARKFRPIRFSRLPVYESTLDHIIGMTHRYKILEALSQDQHTKLVRELILPINSVNERMTVSQALDFFIKEKDHMALVVDDYGGVTGLVTLEDTVETLLGVEIVDEFDNIEDMRKYAMEQWQQRKNNLRR
ncbi:MAG: Mg2+ and Co2+ transporter [Bdellovibrionales bacterium RIFCSPHIGHO2_01_FULL_40_29]|nr:MAG: Mg2+ and Co2+ transporter [Bdellovibrionales bacterium RIFCSPHIGHO2_01_FULL_40_29]OFZ35254.1 MAG: Mg2+ and Co2+ transporter [Bdellovibrionales bacterium RIFCSPHIGHO2_02_FULL_40_15]